METCAIAKVAFLSRVLVICIQILANLLIPDHDANVFNPPVIGTENFTLADKTIYFIFRGLRRWDAIYFMHIAQHGYTYENTVAFFPMYPIIVSAAKSTTGLCSLISEPSLLLMFAVLLNIVMFVVAAMLLLHLGQKLTQDDQLASCAALLFCINPASIFMTAPYTETLFACLSFGGMLCVNQGKLLAGAFLIGVSALTRSNGIVSVGFLLHHCTVKYLANLCLLYRANRLREFRLIRAMIYETAHFAVRTVSFVTLSVIPFAAYQLYIYQMFCFPKKQKQIKSTIDSAIIQYGQAEGFKMAGERPFSPWCYSRLPMSYSYVQSHYWDVGFLAYYQVKQIPNFILAAPIIFLSFCACYSFYCQQPAACRVLGLIQTEKVKVETIGSHASKGETSGWNSAELVVYVVHLFFLTTFGCLFMHIQVVTRFLCSASPVIYWFAAYLVLSASFKSSHWASYLDNSELLTPSTFLAMYKHLSTSARCVVIFFLGYFVIGTVMFSNFLPWT